MFATSTPPCLFLSHSGADTDAARELKRRLLESPDARAAGVRVWLDKDDLVAGLGWQAQLEKAISEEATAFAVHVGAQGVVNWVESEVRLALSRATTASNFPFIPILSKDRSAGSALPPFARQYQAVRDPLNDPTEFTRLLAAVLGRSSGQIAIVLDSPFVGLKAMTEQEADRFFGRDKEIEGLIDKLKRHILVGVVAESGAGKSSLAQAGLIPKFRGGALADIGGREPDDRLWHVVRMRPGNDPTRGLREAVTEAAERLGRTGEECAGLRRRIDIADPSETAYAIRCDLPVRRTETLLILDQFEELLTQTPQALRAPFVDLLMSLAGMGGFRIVLTLRADHFNLCRPFANLFDHLMRDAQAAVLRLRRITKEGIAEAVRKPLRLAGHSDRAEQDALVKAIERDITDHAGDLALVQMALYATWQKHRSDKIGLLVAYSQVGGVAGALAHEAERVRTARLDADERAFLPGIFVRLVRLGQTGGATRRMADFSDFDAPRSILAAKLATEDCGRLLLAGETSVEIAHEALITQWPWLQDTLNAVAGNMRILDRLIDGARRWNTTDVRQREHLATGADRVEFAALAARRPDWLSGPEHEFVAASTRAVHKRRVVSALLVSAIVLLAMVTGFALYSNMELAREQREIAVKSEQATRRAAEIAERERDSALLAQSRLLADLANQHTEKGDAGTATLLALEALPDESAGRKRPLAHEAEAALFKAIDQLRESKVLAHTGAIWAAGVSPNGLLVIGSEDGKAHVWDANNGQHLALDGHDGPVKVAVFSPTGHHLITAGKNAFLWRMGEDRKPFQLEHDGPVSFADFSPDGRFVITASENSASIWNVQDGTQATRLRGHNGRIRAVAFGPNGRWVITGSDDNTARVWDAATGNLFRILEGHGDSVRSVAFSPRDGRVVTASADMTARVWHFETDQKALTLQHGKMVWSAAFSPDGRHVVTASDDGTASLWNAETGELVRVLQHDAPVSRAVFSRDGRNIVTASRDRTATVWDVATGNRKAVLNGHLGWVESVAFVGEDEVLTASRDGTARLWDVRSQNRRGLVLDSGAPVRSAMFVRDGRQILTVENDATVRLWDAETGRRLGSSRDGGLVLTPSSGGKTSEIREASGAHLALLTIPEHPFDWQRVIAKADHDVARFWKADRNEPTVTSVQRFALSPDGKRIARTGADENAFIRDADTGEQLAVLNGHEHSVYSIMFSPNGEWLLTASGDGTARIWSSDMGAPIAVLKGHGGPVWDAAFSPDGKWVVTASNDGTARTWKVFRTTTSLVDEAKTVVPRCLTPDQRKNLFLDSAQPVWCLEGMKWIGK